MPDRKARDNNAYDDKKTVPFADAEEAWFWFITAQAAKNDRAKFVSGQGLYPRPCEPIDILKILDRLHRQRRLMRDHLLVLKHYGQRHMPPDANRDREVRAFQLWTEAMERMSVIMERKGIIQPQRNSHADWFKEALVYENHKMQRPERGLAPSYKNGEYNDR